MRLSDKSIRSFKSTSIEELYANIHTYDSDLLVAVPDHLNLKSDSRIYLLEIDPYAPVDTILDIDNSKYLVDYDLGDVIQIFEHNRQNGNNYVNYFAKSIEFYIKNDAFM